MVYTLQITVSLILDLLFGDPRWLPHPVRGIGFICSKSEVLTRKYIAKPFIAGVITVIIVLFATGGIVFLFLKGCYALSFTAGDIAAVLLLYMTIAARDLLAHSKEVYNKLAVASDVVGARIAVGRIVGRDTSSLDEADISKACVETVAENMVDGITAPFFFALLFSLFGSWYGLSPIGCSALGAFLYKAVNTMDSMIGYKNNRYIDFGRAAAVIDDVLNYIPARISGFITIFAAFILKLDYRGAAKIFFRDRLNHSSPNAAHTEAAVAGALGVRLGGPSVYSGIMVDKPFIGDGSRTICVSDIRNSNRLVMVGSLLFVILFLILRGAGAGLFNGN